MQAERCPGCISRSSGTVFAHSSIAIGHRVRNRQPDGGLMGVGTSPFKTIRSRFCCGSGTGIAESKACVYGCSGFSYSSTESAISTILPKYITATRFEMCSTTARPCPTSKPACGFCRRLNSHQGSKNRQWTDRGSSIHLLTERIRQRVRVVLFLCDPLAKKCEVMTGSRHLVHSRTEPRRHRSGFPC